MLRARRGVRPGKPELTWPVHQERAFSFCDLMSYYYYVYILQSKTNGRYYCGQTSDDLRGVIIVVSFS